MLRSVLAFFGGKRTASVEDPLLRERAFREDFSRSLAEETIARMATEHRQQMEELLLRERAFREDFSDSILGSAIARMATEHRQQMEELLLRERAFREDFSDSILQSAIERMATEQRRLLEEVLVRERLFREEFSHRLHEQYGSGSGLRLRPALVLTKDSQIFTHTIDDHRVMLDSTEPFIAFHMLENGEWERPLRTVLTCLLREGDRYLDVGANIGLHALLAAKLVGRSGRTLALEPHPGTAALFRKNMELNGFQDHVTMVEAAAAEVDGGTRAFEYFEEHSAMSGFALAASRLATFPGTVHKIEVPIISLDALLARQEFAPDVVKIDVEGFELNVLRGAGDLLSRDVAIIIEHAPEYTDSVMGEGAADALAAILFDAGFEACLITEAGCRPMSPAGLAMAVGDAVFVKPGSPRMSRLQLID